MEVGNRLVGHAGRGSWTHRNFGTVAYRRYDVFSALSFDTSLHLAELKTRVL